MDIFNQIFGLNNTFIMALVFYSKANGKIKT